MPVRHTSIVERDTVVCQAELTDEDGTHRLSDAEILSFSHLLLAAGSGTT